MTLQMKFHDVWDEGHDAGYGEGASAVKAELISKKLLKGKTLSQIAEELEETEEGILQFMEEHNLMEKR